MSMYGAPPVKATATPKRNKSDNDLESVAREMTAIDVHVEKEHEVDTLSIKKTGGAKLGAEPSAMATIQAFSLKTYIRESAAFYKANPLKFKKEFLSGLTVAVMQVPESVAFSFVAGVDPLVGLYSTFFLVGACVRMFSVASAVECARGR